MRRIRRWKKACCATLLLALAICGLIIHLLLTTPMPPTHMEVWLYKPITTIQGHRWLHVPRGLSHTDTFDGPCLLTMHLHSGPVSTILTNGGVLYSEHDSLLTGMSFWPVPAASSFVTAVAQGKQMLKALHLPESASAMQDLEHWRSTDAKPGKELVTQQKLSPEEVVEVTVSESRAHKKAWEACVTVEIDPDWEAAQTALAGRKHGRSAAR